ncbi:GIY-YIG nuclease family protein [Candidatus Bathyarchaeota archaeon]|nr:MAG: GIY-YIG nuclease family protein [Candidatus Bathyarchaeota archaeon]
MPYYVYILLCKDGSYYTGYAKDVKRRVQRHKKGQGAKYTSIHEPEKVVYVEELESRSKAMKRERQIKSLSHNQKQRLTKSCNETNPANKLAHP